MYMNLLCTQPPAGVFEFDLICVIGVMRSNQLYTTNTIAGRDGLGCRGKNDVFKTLNFQERVSLI